MNKQQLASRIWESANRMRSKIEANEYKDYILGFIFYKFLSERELEFLRENDFTEEDIKALDESDQETVQYIRENIGFFISYNGLFSTWLEMGSDFGVGLVHDSLSAFSRNINKAHKRVFEGIFDTLQTGLSKLGENSGAQTKAISDLLDVIKDIPMDERSDYDVLGFIYEYLISNFAANAGKKAGEFYTPGEVSQLMSEIVAYHLRDKDQINIYDPTSGSGSLLIHIGKAVARHVGSGDGIKYYAQELKENTYNLTRMNLIMRGILPDNIVARNGDTLEEDWPYFDENDPVGTYNPLYVDAVVSNPPYSQRWEPEGKDTDPRYKYGLAPKSKADYAFLLHDLYHLRPEGVMTIVLPHGVLFRGGEEGNIRKNLLENRHIEAIIGLPANIFFGTGIPTIIMVLRQKREDSDVLIVDASKGFEKVGKNNRLRASDIKRIVDAVKTRKTINKFCRLVPLQEIRDNDYNLNIPRYVDSSEEAESWDIYATMFGGIPSNEINALNDYWKAFPGLREKLFVGSEYPTIAVKDVKEAIYQDESTRAFVKHYSQSFDGFDTWLTEKLISEPSSVEPIKLEEVINDDIFKRLGNIPLVDPYVAYQALDDRWQIIENDLEILQTEGIDAAIQVDPNMVLKKKGGKDVETQDGWVGRIIPFELVQQVMLSNEANQLKAKEDRLSAVVSEIESSIDELSEDEKEVAKDALNNDGSAWAAGSIAKVLKQLKADGLEDYKELIEKLQAAQQLLKEQKELKSQIKKDEVELHLLTKKTIESMDQDQVNHMLHEKWIAPLVNDLMAIPDNLVDDLVSKVNKLSEKYETTLSGITDQITEAEQELSSMIDDLVGNEFDMAGLKEFQRLLVGE